MDLKVWNYRLIYMMLSGSGFCSQQHKFKAANLNFCSRIHNINCQHSIYDEVL